MKSLNNLRLNVLTFAWPDDKPAFYFSEHETEKSRKLYYLHYPKNIDSLFPGITADKNRSLYTTFDYNNHEGKTLNLDFRNENRDLLKRYYNHRINFYFRLQCRQLVKVDFINDNQIWLPLPTLSTARWDVFEKFTIKMQFCQVSDFPELVISYDGRSMILKRSVSEIKQDVDPALLKWIYYNNALIHHNKLVENGFDHFDDARPVLNREMATVLDYERDPTPKTNRYETHLSKIREFIQTYLDTAEFRDLIPLHSCELLNISPVRVSNTKTDSNLLLFASDHTSRVPFSGMADFGPFRPPKWKNIHLFYIFHDKDEHLTRDLHKMLLNGESNYKGLYGFARISVHIAKNFSISFTDKENPLPEIREKLDDRKFDPDVRYIAVYLSPWPKTEVDRTRRKIYFHLKELLLKRNITSQSIDTEKLRVRNGSFHYSLTNIALAMLAKLDGVPWRLNTPVKNELIIGVGAFRHSDTRLKYIGSAFSFDNKGGFNNFEYFLKEETQLLAGSIAVAIRDFAACNQQLERLIIHFYKTMSEKELRPIEEALENLGLEIPVFIISINKTESNDVVGFDTSWQGLMPESGTFINIGRNRYLLFNNTRYANSNFRNADGFPFPVKLSIDCTFKHFLDENQVIGSLIEQVYQFSRLYYKSVRQQGLPITIKYPEILAEIGPNFVNESIPAYGKDNLWFL